MEGRLDKGVLGGCGRMGGAFSWRVLRMTLIAIMVVVATTTTTTRPDDPLGNVLERLDKSSSLGFDRMIGC